MVGNETCKKVKCFKSDNRGEYCSKEFKMYCAYNGIRREKTTSRTPHKWCVERMNKTIMEHPRSMRLPSRLPLHLLAVNTIVYLINRGPSNALDGNSRRGMDW